MSLIDKLKSVFHRNSEVNTEPEYEEPVEHDTVIELRDGVWAEVTADDSEEGEQQQQ